MTKTGRVPFTSGPLDKNIINIPGIVVAILLFLETCVNSGSSENRDFTANVEMIFEKLSHVNLQAEGKRERNI